MTDQELSRLIAEHLEPAPTWNEQRMAFQWSSYVSDGGCWLRPSMSAGFEPRPMVSDPAMTDLLWKKLLDEYDFDTACDFVRETPCVIDEGTTGQWNRAVVEAFCAAEGLTR